MGFRLIRNNEKGSPSEVERMKASELEKESRRWCNLTLHTQEECAIFIARFQDVMRERGIAGEPQADLVGVITQQIATGRASLANVQGNLEINRLNDLVSDTSV